MLDFMKACARDALDKMNVCKENISSKLKVREDGCAIRLTGIVKTRYLDPVSLLPTSDWRIEHNLVVDVAAVQIVKWLVNSTPQAAGLWNYMALGHGGGVAADHANTLLNSEFADSAVAGSLYARESAALTAQAESTNGNKVYQAVATFAASAQTNRDVVDEFGMFTALTSGTGVMFNRSCFAVVRDNKNNALEIIYQCTVAPV